MLQSRHPTGTLRVEHQEHLGRDELELFVNPKLKWGVGDAVIMVGLACQGHEFRSHALGKDVLLLLVGEVELLLPCECPHQAMEDITDTFLVTRDAHRLIRLQDPSGAASFV